MQEEPTELAQKRTPHSEFVVYINGKRHAWNLQGADGGAPPARAEVANRRHPPHLSHLAGLTVQSTLIELLRNVCGLTGTKLGCGEGGCGACAVVMSKWKDGKEVSVSVNACLRPLAACHGR